MDSRIIFAFSLIIIFLSGSHAATFTFKNNCPYTVWPGALAGASKPQLSSTGFELATGTSTSITTPAGWSGRFWGRTQCTTDASGKFTCATGDCSSGQIQCNGGNAVPPASLIELTLAQYGGGQDFYDVSLVDGFNLPVALTPQGVSGGGCLSTSCPGNMNAVCPQELAVKGGSGSVIACKAACTAFNKPEYCCTEAFGSPDTCRPTNYSRLFKRLCPQAYSYAYDDGTSTFTCKGGPNYVVTFCP